MDSPAAWSEATSWKWAELPCATATVRPLRSAAFVSFEPFGTTIASPSDEPCWAPTTVIFDLEPAAKTGGVFPTPPMSTALALTASSSGGPEVNVDHLILYVRL